MRNTTAILLTAAALLLAIPGQSTTVTTTADSGPGSLRNAIVAAAPGETIDFAVSGTIALTSGPLLINKNLIIAGPGAASLTVQGTPSFRVFDLQPPGIVTVSGLTIRNGSAPVGGGINNETVATLVDCVISGNSATQRGGGIRNANTLTLTRCIVTNNRVTVTLTVGAGGGLNNEGTATAVDCVFSHNRLDVLLNGSDAFGGGVNNDGTLAMTNCIIAENRVMNPVRSIASGGGIFNQGTLTLHTSAVRLNQARSGQGSAHGGGIGNAFGTVTLDRSTVSGNQVFYDFFGPGPTGAAHGGGLYNDLGTVTIFNSTVSGNIAGSVWLGAALSEGGGIYSRLGAVTVRHATIVSNGITGGRALLSGSGLFNERGFVESKNTILAANGPEFDLFNSSGDIVSGGFNLIGSAGSVTVPFVPGPNEIYPFPADAIRLGPLQNNGGPTFTHALLCGSPALNAGDNTDAPSTDQRGFPRIVHGVIDIGAYESANVAPTITCPAPITINCAPPDGQFVTVSVNVADADGDPLRVVWFVDGIAIQTNLVAAGGPPTSARVDLRTQFGLGEFDVAVMVTDVADCMAACATTVTVNARGDLYPIALHTQSLAGVPVGGVIRDIYNGVRPGQFGWLTWAGNPSEPTLAASLTPPGNSHTYVNPFNRRDKLVSVGDWVRGKPGLSNSDKVRRALDTLKTLDIVVPVWDRGMRQGGDQLYRVAGFARVRLTDFQLPVQNRISARFLGWIECEPAANSVVPRLREAEGRALHSARAGVQQEDERRAQSDALYHPRPVHAPSVRPILEVQPAHEPGRGPGVSPVRIEPNGRLAHSVQHEKHLRLTESRKMFLEEFLAP